MQWHDTTRRMQTLWYMDHETVGMYGQAVSKAEDPQVSDALRGFMEDHERHARELRDLLERMAGFTGEASDDLVRFVEEESRLVGEAIDEDELMERMLLAELANAAEYRLATEVDMPRGVGADLVRGHYADERRHVEFLERHTPSSAVDLKRAQAARVGVGPEPEAGGGGLRREEAEHRVGSLWGEVEGAKMGDVYSGPGITGNVTGGGSGGEPGRAGGIEDPTLGDTQIPEGREKERPAEEKK